MDNRKEVQRLEEHLPNSRLFKTLLKLCCTKGLREASPELIGSSLRSSIVPSGPISSCCIPRSRPLEHSID